MTKVEQVMQLIPPEDLHYVEEWKDGTAGFHEAAKDWLKDKDPVKDDEEIAREMAHAIGTARKFDSEQRTKRGAEMSRRECLEMEDRNIKFVRKLTELGIW